MHMYSCVSACTTNKRTCRGGRKGKEIGREGEGEKKREKEIEDRMKSSENKFRVQVVCVAPSNTNYESVKIRNMFRKSSIIFE